MKMSWDGALVVGKVAAVLAFISLSFQRPLYREDLSF